MSTELALPDTIKVDVRRIEATATIEQIAEYRDRLEGVQRLIKEALATCDEDMTAWIHENKKPIEWTIDDEGHVRRFFLATKKTTKCKSNADVFTVLMGFSVEDAVDCMASNAWKHGAIRKLLEANNMGDKYAELFEVVETEKLDEKEAPKRLQSINTRFLD